MTGTSLVLDASRWVHCAVLRHGPQATVAAVCDCCLLRCGRRCAISSLGTQCELKISGRHTCEQGPAWCQNRTSTRLSLCHIIDDLVSRCARIVQQAATAEAAHSGQASTAPACAMCGVSMLIPMMLQVDTNLLACQWHVHAMHVLPEGMCRGTIHRHERSPFASANFVTFIILDICGPTRRRFRPAASFSRSLNEQNGCDARKGEHKHCDRYCKRTTIIKHDSCSQAARFHLSGLRM